MMTPNSLAAVFTQLCLQSDAWGRRSILVSSEELALRYHKSQLIRHLQVLFPLQKLKLCIFAFYKAHKRQWEFVNVGEDPRSRKMHFISPIKPRDQPRPLLRTSWR